MSEYDARSRPATKSFRDNFDDVFGKKKQKPKAEETCHLCYGTGECHGGQHTFQCPACK